MNFKLMKYFALPGILLAYVFFTVYLKQVLFPIHYVSHNFFFFELIGKSGSLSFEFLLLLSAGIVILLWLIGRLIFNNSYALLPSIIYAISPWASYLVVAESFYIFLLFLLLVVFYGLLLIKSGQVKWGLILTIGGSVICMYSSVILLILIPIIFLFLIFLKLIALNSFKIYFAILILLLLPLFFLIYKNQTGFKQIVSIETKIFSDPGLINNVNSYQGAARDANFGSLAKISENKYIFISEYVLIKYSKQLIPTTYFTQQEKLLNFSFIPPLYLAGLIPFLYGLYKIIQMPVMRKNLLLSTMLVIPSVLSEQIVDLNRLILFFPVIILLTTYGVTELAKQRKNTHFFLTFLLFLVVVQSLFTLYDINIREKGRYIKYFNQNFQIGKQ